MQHSVLSPLHGHDMHPHMQISLNNKIPVDLACRTGQRWSKDLRSSCQQRLKDDHTLQMRGHLFAAQAGEKSRPGPKSLSFRVPMLLSSKWDMLVS